MTGHPTYREGVQHGIDARHAGLPRASCLDPTAMAIISLASIGGAPVGVGIDYLEGWNAGWDLANLEEPSDA